MRLLSILLLFEILCIGATGYTAYTARLEKGSAAKGNNQTGIRRRAGEQTRRKRLWMTIVSALLAVVFAIAKTFAAKHASDKQQAAFIGVQSQLAEANSKLSTVEIELLGARREAKEYADEARKAQARFDAFASRVEFTVLDPLSAEIIEGTKTTAGKLSEEFPYGFCVMYGSQEDHRRRFFLPGDMKYSMSYTVKVHPDFNTRKVIVAFEEKRSVFENPGHRPMQRHDNSSERELPLEVGKSYLIDGFALPGIPAVHYATLNADSGNFIWVTGLRKR